MRQSCASCKHALFKGREHYGQCTIHWCLDGSAHPMISKDWTCGSDCKDYYCYEKLAAILNDHAAEVRTLQAEMAAVEASAAVNAAEVERLKKDYAALEARCAEMTSHITELITDNSRFIAERDALQAKLAAAEDALRGIYNGLVEINPNNHDEDDVFTQNNSVIESIQIAAVALADTTTGEVQP